MEFGRQAIKLGGGLLAIIGLAGLPDDVATWSRWIDFAMRDDRILALAEKAVELSSFVNQYWVRAILVAIGLIIVLWSSARLWRVRNRISFWVRSTMAEQVWVSRETAYKVLESSEWAELKHPHITHSTLEALAFRQTISGLPERVKAARRFKAYLSATLSDFCKRHPSAVRKTDDDEIEIDEAELKEWLDKVLEKEVSEEFGGIPRI